MMGEMSLKTVFVLDHCKQMKEATGMPIDIDLGPKTPGNGSYFQFIPSLMKSLWSCMAESTLEYARIVWDLFGEERYVRFVTSNPQKAITLNDWNRTQQHLGFAHEAFAAAGPPFIACGSIQVGIAAAVKALAEPTPSQMKCISVTGDVSKGHVANKGRIVCITSCLVDLDFRDILLACLNKNSSTSSGNPWKLPIEQLEFTLISLHPVGKEDMSRVLSQPFKEIASNVKFETMVVSVADLNTTMQDLCIRHHDLVTTVVTGIPMKEEANANSSLNYDVPMYHPRVGPPEESQLLKWSGPTPPKGISGHMCNMACRTTPVEVISRPTTCLSNFVLSGRSVWLEVLKKTKASSNLLISHGGELWMHFMESTRNVLDDPPAISEGSGGRVGDYRISDFVEFMKQNLLAPYPSSQDQATDSYISPKELAKQRLWRKSAYWPITMSGSMLCSLSAHLDTLLKYFPNDKLDEMQKLECDKSFWSIMAIEARGDPPPLSSFTVKKGFKKDEQWRALYSEIETFLRANVHSAAHQSVLDCFIESRQKDETEDVVTNGNMKRPASNGASKGEASPPPAKKPKLMFEPESPKLNLLALWRLKTTDKQKPKILPEGLKLYAHLKETPDPSIKSAK